MFAMKNFDVGMPFWALFNRQENSLVKNLWKTLRTAIETLPMTILRKKAKGWETMILAFLCTKKLW
jgi:hypothetical protein